jgi:DegV family protein with EDD domain
MEKFVIICDVTCDLNKELRDKYDIKYVKGHMTGPDGKERVTTLDWTDFTHDEFYNDLKKNPNGYSTSPASPEEFKEVFEKFLVNGFDILSISISTALSGTYNFSLQAREMLKNSYPNRKIVCINSLRYSTGFGLLAVRASMLRAEGKSLDEVASWVEENKNCCHQAGFLDDLSFVAAKGRLSKSKAFMGKLIGIKPMGEFDYNGLTTIIGKAKGDKASIEATIKYMKKTILNPEEQIIFIASTNRMKQALQLKEKIEAEFKPKEVIITDVYPADGINIGPGLMSAYYFGTKISEGLVNEKEIMAEALAK